MHPSSPISARMQLSSMRRAFKLERSGGSITRSGRPEPAVISAEFFDAPPWVCREFSLDHQSKDREADDIWPVARQPLGVLEATDNNHDPGTLSRFSWRRYRRMAARFRIRNSPAARPISVLQDGSGAPC